MNIDRLTRKKELMELYSIRITEATVSLDETMLDNDVLYHLEFAPTAIVMSIVADTPGVAMATCTEDPLTFAYTLDQENRNNSREIAIEMAYRIARCFRDEALICGAIDLPDASFSIIPDARDLIAS